MATDLYLVSLGIVMDLATLKENGIQWRHIFGYYQIRSLRSLVAWASPLAVAMIGIGQQILTGQLQNAITSILRGLPRVAPPGV
jgi:hypothetical protein